MTELDLFADAPAELDHELVAVGTRAAFAKLKDIRSRDIQNTIDESWVTALAWGWQAMCAVVRERNFNPAPESPIRAGKLQELNREGGA